MLLSILVVIIFLSILILVHELGHFWAAKKSGLLVEEFGFGLPPRLWSKKIGETLYSINALPFGGFVKIYGEDPSEKAAPELKKRSFMNQPATKRLVILAAGVFMNFLLGWILVSLIFMVGLPQAVFISNVSANSPAAQTGFQANDKVMEFKTISEFTDFINKNKGKEISIKIERNGKEMEFKAKPRLSPPQGQGPLGVALVEGGQPKQNFFRSFWSGLKTSAQIFAAVFVVIFNLLKAAVLGQGSLAGVTGPVGIVKITAQAGSLGFLYVLQFLALISLNLAAINFFPFPALDGGRILFLLIEKIKGSPLPVKFEKYANALGMAFLLFVMALITIRDIGGLF